MNVLVTGATGFVGARLVRKALDMRPDWQLHVLARSASPHWRIADLQERITTHEGDVTDLESLKRVVTRTQPTRVFHFANAGVYGGMSAGAQKLLQVNTIGLANILEALENGRCESFINIGSSSEYGLKNGPMSESDRCEPVNAYGISKLAATHLARLAAMRDGVPIATFRLFSPYGPQDDPSRLVSQAIAHFLAGTAFQLPHHAAVRDYVFVDDTVELFIAASDSVSQHAGEVFNVGSGTEMRAQDIVERIAVLLGKEDILDKSAAAGTLGPSESPRWVAAMHKTEAAFNWKAHTSLEDGLSATVGFMRDNLDRYMR